MPKTPCPKCSGDDVFLTPAEVAAIFRVTLKALARWDDKLKPIRTPGGHRRFRLGEVNKYLNPGG